MKGGYIISIYKNKVQLVSSRSYQKSLSLSLLFNPKRNNCRTRIGCRLHFFIYVHVGAIARVFEKLHSQTMHTTGLPLFLIHLQLPKPIFGSNIHFRSLSRLLSE